MRRLIPLAAIGIAATLLAIALLHIHAVAGLDAVAIDIRERAFSPETAASPEVALVVLDEATMKALPYRSPVPRDFLASLHRRIAAAGPRVIGYDIFFKDPSFPDADERFATALREHSAYGVVPRRVDGGVDEALPLFEGVLAGTGLADLPFDPLSEVVRQARLVYGTKDGPRKSFAAAIFEAATGAPAEGAAPAPEFLIRFAGTPFTSYSASLVERGLVPGAWLAGKIVLVGAGFRDLKDTYLTPLSGRTAGFATMNGVEIHAHILSDLLTRQFYRELSPWGERAIAFLLALVVAGASILLAPLRAWAAAFAAASLYIAAAAALFSSHAVVLPVAGPLAAAVASSGMGTLWRALTEGRQRRFIKAAFSQYVPAAVVERLTERPELLALGGETRIVTSLFTDIASFTAIAEQLSPQELVAFLNDYLGRMNGELFRFGATLDKYEGDAIIAFFNAPLDVAGHELAAARAALGIRRASAEVSREWRGRCGREIVTRVGVATGTAVVGNMGSEGRFDYTAIGDTINLASRLEGANKFYGTAILAADATAAAIAGAVATRPVDRVRVKGKGEEILLHEIVGEAADVGADREASLLDPYRAAFDRFSARDLSAAGEACRAILAAFPEDGPTRGLLARCERAEREPAWDLVTELTSK